MYIIIKGIMEFEKEKGSVKRTLLIILILTKIRNNRTNIGIFSVISCMISISATIIKFIAFITFLKITIGLLILNLLLWFIPTTKQLLLFAELNRYDSRLPENIKELICEIEKER